MTTIDAKFAALSNRFGETFLFQGARWAELAINAVAQLYRASSCVT
ncbi:hypothetical protein PWG15_33660 (plasmid) [Ensifer adhaerens]|nr:hypothetical protein [Ensifer adhaerens]WDZ81855.1 hypothetical protein PWG15_33660 [Ensifer adhaerens]